MPFLSRVLPSHFFVMAGLAFMTLATPATPQEPSAPPPSEADWDMIAFEVKSWGQPLTQWQFTPSYGGVWIEIARKQDSVQPTWTKTYHPLESDMERYTELERLVRRLQSPAPDPAECTNMMTDQPYGTIRLTRGATTTEIAWNAGCMDTKYIAFMSVLREADELVAGWGKAAPASRTEDHLIP